MALLAAAREILASDDIEFVASLDQLESDVVGPWTLRDALVVASRCDRKVGPFAYWENREIGDALTRVWERVAEHVDAPSPEGWSSSKGRTKAEILNVLDSALDAGDDIAAPQPVTIRLWCGAGREVHEVVAGCWLPPIPRRSRARPPRRAGGASRSCRPQSSWLRPAGPS